MTKNDAILQVENLTKRYRRLVAVDDISFSIEPGEFVALIGPNGAGKSTTMGCIAGTVAADEGALHIAGADVTKNPVGARRNLGFVPQHLTLLDFLTGLEYLQFVADLRDVTASERDEQIEELLAISELEDARHVILREYSGGMLRKLALSSVLVGPPKLLVLDESFVGLDPESTYRIRKRLESHCAAGGAILLSSHILDMLEPLCHRFLILVDGKLAADVSAPELERMRKSDEVENLTDLYLETTGKKEAIAG